ncbi:unnamed protein product, partial [Brassica rapa subsp. narinosa]
FYPYLVCLLRRCYLTVFSSYIESLSQCLHPLYKDDSFERPWIHGDEKMLKNTD